NVSSKQFQNSSFVEDLQNILMEVGLPPQCLELEITERTFIHNVDVAIQRLHDIKEMGIQLSIDDFGTGYSSLSYLNRFPIDLLKIDHSFVQAISEKREAEIIATTIIAMAHNLGMEVIAEGVETTEQQNFLINHGCKIMQGYLFSRPVSAE